ncbi:MAG: hypothetical protein A2458_02450 [Candidatus Kerfeldbacteria bacterium RIFOXYC2_FULL_38_9]|nr:MAG: hypothetical protein A2458_02450 [Candidatus Kerfeldbacteria bacterium RIFOXYC2_FULL_38_9]
MKKIYSLLTVVLVFVPFAVQAAFGDTTTYLSKPFEVHKARLAKDALFDFPTDIDVTDDGIFVIADTYNHAIRKITKKGKVKTIAGNGSYGDKSGARFKAEFAYPQGVDIDNGVVYVADTGNHRISKIKDGQVTTLVQNLNAPEGVRVFGDILYFLDTGNGLLKKVSINGGKVTTVASGLSGPKKLTITVDGAYAYVANVGTYQVKKVNLASGQVTTLAGSGSAGEKNGACATATFRNLYGVHLDGNYLYVSDGNGSSDFVRRIDLTACQVETFASDESMVSINYPNGLTTYNGGLYVVATGISIVEKYNLDDAAVNSKFAGKDRFNVRDAKPVLIGNPKYLQLSKDKKWIIFSENNRIRKVKRTNLKDSELIAGSVVDNYNTNKDGDNTPRVGADARFSDVTSFAVSKDGKKLYVVDRNNNRIKEVDLKTRTMTYLTGAGGINAASNSNGSADGIACSNEYETGKKNCAYFNRPQGSVLAKDGKILYVTDTGNHSIRAVIVKGDNK